jgi:lysophospholipase L1-like esterase
MPKALWAAAAMTVVLAGVLTPSAGAVSQGDSYVALGDSFTAGPVILLPIPPLGCFKSNHNYPHLVAGKLRLQLKDASCSGATTADMTHSQDVALKPDPPPQFDALDQNTDVVTVGIGGNDIGFSEISRNCSSQIDRGTPCRDRYVRNGRDEISARIKRTVPKVANVLKGIHSRSPNAAVYLVNYLPILPDDGSSCHPQVRITKGDAPYLRDKERELNKMLADQAAANNAKLVDAYTAGIGFDACKNRDTRWVEPAVPLNFAAPLHPNRDGMQGITKQVVSAFA